MITLFWTSSDISCGFQSQSGLIYSTWKRRTCNIFPVSVQYLPTSSTCLWPGIVGTRLGKMLYASHQLLFKNLQLSHPYQYLYWKSYYRTMYNIDLIIWFQFTVFTEQIHPWIYVDTRVVMHNLKSLWVVVSQTRSILHRYFVQWKYSATKISVLNTSCLCYHRSERF